MAVKHSRVNTRGVVDACSGLQLGKGGRQGNAVGVASMVDSCSGMGGESGGGGGGWAGKCIGSRVGGRRLRWPGVRKRGRQANSTYKFVTTRYRGAHSPLPPHPHVHNLTQRCLFGTSVTIPTTPTTPAIRTTCEQEKAMKPAASSVRPFLRSPPTYRPRSPASLLKCLTISNNSSKQHLVFLCNHRHPATPFITRSSRSAHTLITTNDSSKQRESSSSACTATLPPRPPFPTPPHLDNLKGQQQAAGILLLVNCRQCCICNVGPLPCSSNAVRL